MERIETIRHETIKLWDKKNGERKIQFDRFELNQTGEKKCDFHCIEAYSQKKIKTKTN